MERVAGAKVEGEELVGVRMTELADEEEGEDVIENPLDGLSMLLISLKSKLFDKWIELKNQLIARIRA